MYNSDGPKDAITKSPIAQQMDVLLKQLSELERVVAILEARTRLIRLVTREPESPKKEAIPQRAAAPLGLFFDELGTRIGAVSTRLECCVEEIQC